MLNDQKLGNYLEVCAIEPTNSKSKSWENGERPVTRMTRELCKMEEKRPVLRRSMLIFFAKNLVLQSERGDL